MRHIYSKGYTVNQWLCHCLTAWRMPICILSGLIFHVPVCGGFLQIIWFPPPVQKHACLGWMEIFPEVWGLLITCPVWATVQRLFFIINYNLQPANDLLEKLSCKKFVLFHGFFCLGKCCPEAVFQQIAIHPFHVWMPLLKRKHRRV